MNLMIKSFILPAILFMSACSQLESLNPFAKKKKDNKNLIIAAAVIAANQTDISDGLMQEISVTSGTAVTAVYGSGSVLFSERALAAGNENSTKIEYSVTDTDGIEQTYKRTGDGNASLSFTPTKTGTYRVNFKNNSAFKVAIGNSSLTGASSSAGVGYSNSKAKYKDIFLKAYIGFSAQCSTFSGTTTAVSGNYFIQPFVFLGKIGTGKKVTDISTATVTVSFGGKTLTLKKLSDYDSTKYDNPNNPSNSIPSTDTENKIKYIKSFYQGFFGGAGEMYVLDNFNKSSGATCSTADTFTLGTSNQGQNTLTLSITDTANSISESFKIRPSATDSYMNSYFPAGTAFSDYSTCKYNTTTGEPECTKTFSMSDPPYSLLNTAVANDQSYPTRVLMYGYSIPKSLYSQIVKNSSALSAGTLTSLTVDGCLNNGGLVSMPFSQTDKNYMPLREFSTVKDDIVQLGSKLGSYTYLSNFYQGNADLSGSVKMPICIPSSSQPCASYKAVTLVSPSCRVKVDSGIAVGGVSATWTAVNSFIYPDSVGGSLSAKISD
ncbi:MAG TPA: hypothetical protein PK453_00460 [Leptospiraceae bacterium]|nr:hypothetical protein [Leptospiraceae bacterium]HNF12110.1 hypothetical protein [Leptospiraceae bacterium]HNF23004.1 hypothetical protein [Leptospiraceae bacterium]HNM01691.1 hypothetical protein [Leptospiraceae bacterium]HNN02292.1 hypothetical protein [Leptospiraceae bacterium]